MSDPGEDPYERLTGLAKRRGIFYPSYEIYGGVSGFYDLGPLGTRLEQELQDLWRDHYVLGEGYLEIASPTVSPEEVFRASGHLAAFADVEVTCDACGQAFRADHYIEEAVEGVRDALGEVPDELDALLSEKVEVAAEEPGVEEIARVLTEGWVDGEVVAEEPGARFVVGDAEAALACLECGERAWDPPERFNLMFKTYIGAGKAQTGYLRPETAQGIFVAFRDLYRFAREQLPFGVVQLGSAYRNEISPRQGVIRLREFRQMEAEVFFDPEDKTHPRFDEVAEMEVRLVPNTDPDSTVTATIGEAVEKGIVVHEALGYFMGLTQRYLTEVGIDPERLRFRQHLETEMAHYSQDTWDAEAESERFGWVELVGIADRTDYDLRSHEDEAGTEMVHHRPLEEPYEETVRRIEPDMAELGPLFKDRAGRVADALRDLDPDDVDGEVEVTVDGETVSVPAEAFEVVEETERVTVEAVRPHVVEPSYGLDRIFYFALEHSFEARAERGWDVLHLPAGIAPTKVGVFPLMSKDGLDDRARELDRRLRQAGLQTYYDDSGNIGRRYARQDEVGTPLCVTVDYEALEGEGVTVRDRESMEQVRVPDDELVGVLEELLAGERSWAEVADAFPSVEGS